MRLRGVSDKAYLISNKINTDQANRNDTLEVQFLKLGISNMI